jgi:hypothetical protein
MQTPIYVDAQPKEKKATNKKHRAKIESEAIYTLSKLCGPAEAEKVVDAISEGKIPNIYIKY